MKKWLLLAFTLLVCISFSCGKKVDHLFFEANGKLKVLSTTAMIDNLVGIIGGDKIDHMSLIIGDLDPHSYELVKGDDEKLMSADVIFSNGLGLEHGASLRRHLSAHSCSIPLGDQIYHKTPEKFIFVEGTLDPHFWMDVALFSEVIDPIVQTLSEKDPEHAEFFALHGKKLKEEMQLKDVELAQKIHEISPEKRFLVTSHDAFYYFAKRYLAQPGEKDWEKRFIAPEGLAPDGQMSIVDIQEVSDFLCEHQIHVVFPETNINQDALKKIVSICKEKGLFVKIAEVPLFGDTMGPKPEGARSYLKMMEHNVNALSQELPE